MLENEKKMQLINELQNIRKMICLEGNILLSSNANDSLFDIICNFDACLELGVNRKQPLVKCLLRLKVYLHVIRPLSYQYFFACLYLKITELLAKF